MKRDRRNGDGVVVVVRETDDDGRERDFVDDDRRDCEMDLVVGDCGDGSRLGLFVCLLSGFDCDFGGDIGGCRDLVTGLAVVTGFVSGSVVEGGVEVREFVGGILCLRLIFVGLVLETEMSVEFVRRRLWVFVSLLTVVNLVQAGLDWR
jgi:hypothetical protein